MLGTVCLRYKAYFFSSGRRGVSSQSSKRAGGGRVLTCLRLIVPALQLHKEKFDGFEPTHKHTLPQYGQEYGTFPGNASLFSHATLNSRRNCNKVHATKT